MHGRAGLAQPCCLPPRAQLTTRKFATRADPLQRPNPLQISSIGGVPKYVESRFVHIFYQRETQSINGSLSAWEGGSKQSSHEPHCPLMMMAAAKA